jgi:SAM-dependent methyltransferase
MGDISAVGWDAEHVLARRVSPSRRVDDTVVPYIQGESYGSNIWRWCTELNRKGDGGCRPHVTAGPDGSAFLTFADEIGILGVVPVIAQLGFMSLLARFLAANRRMSSAIEAHLPAPFTQHLHTLYKMEVAAAINTRPGQAVFDIGGGKDCPFLPFVKEPGAHLIVALDRSDHELRLNRDLDNKIVADAASREFPFRDASADLIVSRSVVEHLHDSAVFFENCARVLRPGGLLIHTFPCKFAPFSLLNQTLPNRVTRRLLAYLHPQWEDECGFLAFYDHCSYSGIRTLLNRTGFQNPQFVFRYYQSIYFDFFVPFYILMLAYDLIAWGLGIRNLACAILVTAEQPIVRVGERGARAAVIEPQVISAS